MGNKANVFLKAWSHFSDNDNDAKRRILLVELLHAEYAHAHSTNGMRYLFIVIVLVLVAVGPGL